MMAATLASGTTVIEHAACEPEIQDLGHFLNACGASIAGLGTGTITIEGTGRRRKSHLRGCYHTVIPDRIEAGTLACAAAITNGDVLLQGVRIGHIAALLDTMRRMGVRFEVQSDSGGHAKGSHKAPGQSELPPSGAWRAEKLRVYRKGRLKPVDFDCRPYPGLPTDMQALLMATLCLADGTSTVTDHVHPERFNQVTELNRLGAEISHGSSPGQAMVRGPAELTGATVTARDIRGGASLIVAALAAEGRTVVEDTWYVDRGYEHIERTLSALGANIRRVELPQAAEAPPQQRRLAS
jgi:UDP-N-acetylglucosamine 1-carboxyvinyltransferase